jgi:GWxTD domain-containing protein
MRWLAVLLPSIVVVLLISGLRVDEAAAFTIALPPPPHADLADEEIFTRIDRLESRYREAPQSERAGLAVELGALYLATGMPKHFEVGQEYLAEATRLDPSGEEAVYLSATEYARSGYFDLAQQRMSALFEREPGNVEHLLMLARLEFVAKRLKGYDQDIHGAYQLYVAALGQAPDREEALVGAGVTALLVENYQLARSCAQRLRERHPDRADCRFLGAAAQFRLDNHQQAWLEFLQAMAICDASERQVYLGGDILVTDDNLLALARATIEPARAREVLGLAPDAKIDWYRVVEDPGMRAELVERWWMARDESPDAFENESELEYWTRLVEADLLFARPDLGRRGWETMPGETWVRMGRPRAQSYWLPIPGEDVIFQRIVGPAMTLPAIFGGLAPRYSGGLTSPPPRRIWDWSYVVDGVPVSVQFSDFTYGVPEWGVGPWSPTDLGTLRNEVVFLPAGRKADPSPFELGTAVACFPRGEDSILETAISVRSLGLEAPGFAEGDSTVIEWTLMDADGEPLDQTQDVLTDATRLSRLLATSGQTVSHITGDPRLAMVGARVPAGRYQIRVRAIDPRNGRFSGRTLEVGVPDHSTPEGLAISSVQLSHGLPPWDPRGRFPVEFVKHGRAVISAPRAVIEGNTLGVYYELANLGQEASGETRFDVEYAIYEATGQVRLLAMLGRFEPEDLEEVELVTVQYLQERTGVSPEGLVVKGTEIDISALHAGDYVLRIRIDDLVAGQQESAAIAFRRPAGRPSG